MKSNGMSFLIRTGDFIHRGNKSKKSHPMDFLFVYAKGVHLILLN